MNGEDKVRRVLSAFFSFLTFFVIICFIVTCSTMLFVTLLTNALGVTLNDENVSIAAKATFINVIIISVLLTVVDFFRRRFALDKPVEEIRASAQKIISGDFNVRIGKVNSIFGGAEFNEVIDCFNSMAEELSGVESLRTDFISNVSHEMKTPITVIRNYATLLSSEQTTEEERAEYSRGIISATTRLSDMVSNILKLSKLENQQIYPNTERFSLTEELCSAILAYEQIWEEKEITLIANIPDDVYINADKELLSIVWSNLLSNAFKFTDRGGTVEIDLAESEDSISVTVTDTGCGMSPEVGSRIFEKFYQADGSRSTEGNGLGLALVKRIVDIMRGEISVSSKLGEGTSFTVTLWGINER